MPLLRYILVCVRQRALDDLIYEHQRHARARLLRIQAKGREARAALSAATGVAQIERLTLQRAATDRLLKRYRIVRVLRIARWMTGMHPDACLFSPACIERYLRVLMQTWLNW